LVPNNRRQVALIKDRPLGRGRLLLFPENREGNREFLKFPAVSTLSTAFWSPFALQLQLVADDSLFCTEQGMCFAKTGNSPSE